MFIIICQWAMNRLVPSRETLKRPLSFYPLEENVLIGSKIATAGRLL